MMIVAPEIVIKTFPSAYWSQEMKTLLGLDSYARLFVMIVNQTVIELLLPEGEALALREVAPVEEGEAVVQEEEVLVAATVEVVMEEAELYFKV